MRVCIRAMWTLFPRLMLRVRDLSGCTTLTRDSRFLNLYRMLYRDGRVRMTIRELYNLYELGQRAAQLPQGDFAEFGVYKGGSARMLAEVKGDRRLWLFDTFEGMPEADGRIDEFERGDFGDTSLESVQQYLAPYADLRYVQGLFPESAHASGAAAARYAFANLDVDLYRSTHDGLTFFYPRMVPGGVLISHDYFELAAVKQAFDDFFADKPEPVLHLFDNQAAVVKQ
jgi:hypothetical protein